MKIFIICPVRNATKEIREKINKHIKTLENCGYFVYYPARDTNQKDIIGLRICQDNKKALIEADAIHLFWDGKSQGFLFDLGMAFALNKKVVPIMLPELTENKSFQNMIAYWAAKENQ